VKFDRHILPFGEAIFTIANGKPQHPRSYVAMDALCAKTSCQKYREQIDPVDKKNKKNM